MRLLYIFIFLLSFQIINGAEEHISLQDILQGKLPRTKRDILDYLNVMDFEWIQKFLEKILGDIYVDISENDKYVQTYITPSEEDQNSKEIEFTTSSPEITTIEEYIPTTSEKTGTMLYNTIRPTNKTIKLKSNKNKTIPKLTTTEAPFLGTTTTRRIQTYDKISPYKVITPSGKKAKSLLRTGTIKNEEKTSIASIPADLADFCVTKCDISPDCGNNEKLVKYAHIHNSGPEDTMKALAKESQIIEKQMLPIVHKTADAEVVQFTMNILRAFKPLRSLVIGVFTGYSTIGISLMSDPQGIVIGLEDPELVDYWEAVGKKTSHHLGLTQRIQIRATDAVDRELHKLAQYEPTAFDFILLDDYKYRNYLTDYEMAVNILRTEGILIITNSFSNNILSKNANELSEDDKVIRALNYRIKNDPRIVSTLLPISDGTWLIVKK
uniref:O-methyltransferase n=1 Tax=Parastrongyloides trichosuri TaxID=131310 RepID=A0A0N5A3F1_PARTI